MKHRSRTLAALTATSLAAAGLVGLTTGGANAATGGVLIYGLTTTNTLVKFRADTPGTTIGAPLPISGLTAGEDLVGIDVRPATGELYGVVDGPADRIVTINPATGASTAIANLSVQLVGTNFGVDFNPVPDRLRIVSDADQNLRVVPTTGVVTVDGALAYAAGDPRAGTNPAVRGAGYTNNVNGAASTVLYDYDVAGGDALATQNPPNSGMLNTSSGGPTNVPETAGPATGTASVGLDVEAVTNIGYLLVDSGSGPVLWRTSSSIGFSGPFDTFLGATAPTVEDIAVASPRFSVGDATGAEGGNASVVVTRTGDTGDTATVTITPAAGSATAGDFDPATKTVTFAAGDTAATATVALTADALAEPSETFTVTIAVTGGGGNEAVADGTGVVTITDVAPVEPSPSASPTVSMSPSSAPGGGGGGVPASPTASASASASASPSGSPLTSPSATTSPTQGTAPGCVRAAAVVLGRSTIIATGSSPVSVTATPGSVVDLFAYTRPSTTYRLVRSGTTDASGNASFAALKPPANTRLYAQQRGCAIGQSVVLNVRTALSLQVVRTGTRTYTFSGDSLPARPGGLIVSLYRVTASGAQILTSQTRASASTGDWVINRRFTGTGRFGFVVRTGQDLQNAPGVSNVRSLLVF